MTDDKDITPVQPTNTPPATGGGDDFAEGLRRLEAAGQVDDDAVEIAADDQGATAMAQKLGEIGGDDGSPQG